MHNPWETTQTQSPELQTQITGELKEIIENTKKNVLLEILKEKAYNIDFSWRRLFEHALMHVTETINDYELRNILYETMASLSSIWHANEPEMLLKDTFQTAYNKKKFEDARHAFSRLRQQGLDYLGVIDVGRGILTPFLHERRQSIFRYNGKSITFFSNELKELNQIVLPEGLKIKHWSLSPLSLDGIKLSNRNAWMLTEDDEGHKRLVALNMHTGVWADEAFNLKGDWASATAVSQFQERLLLVCPNAIYRFRHHKGWEEWFTADAPISCVESSGARIWIGLSNGDVFALKDFKLVGLRKKLKLKDSAVIHMCSSRRYTAIAGSRAIHIVDLEGNDVVAPLQTKSKVKRVLLIDDRVVIVSQVNGILLCKDINVPGGGQHVNTGWGDMDIFYLRDEIYCCKPDGNIKRFVVPNLPELVAALEKENIPVPAQPLERDITAPITFLKDFISRKELLDLIRDSGNTHYFITGEPKMGKTSFLNVLPYVLAGNSRCCYIDMTSFWDEIYSYTDFETIFIERSISMNDTKEVKIRERTGFQALQEVVNKTRGTKSYCVFCLDNFSLPIQRQITPESMNAIKTFIKEMFVHPQVRIITTCNIGESKDVKDFLDSARLAAKEIRKLANINLPLLSAVEVKSELRGRLHQDGQDVDHIFRYTGGFPNHVHLYDKWNKKEEPLDEYSKEIARNYFNTILDYFRDLTPEALYLVTLLLDQELTGQRISYEKLYAGYPILEDILPLSALKEALTELKAFKTGLQVSFIAVNEGEDFKIDGTPKHKIGSSPVGGDFLIRINGGSVLFKEASAFVQWLPTFHALCRFRGSQNQEGAEEVTRAFSRLVKIGVTSNKQLNKTQKNYHDFFHIKQLTKEGQKELGMPLVTFLVIPLYPWEPGKLRKEFASLYTSLAESVRKSHGRFAKDSASTKFYILLFEFFGTPPKTIKTQTQGLERVSVIDIWKTADIMFSTDPLLKSTEYIFRQLRISERSPYTTSGAVQDDLFFGRGLEIALIRGLNENIGIFGTRTIGKTSLLLKLHRDLKRQKKWRVVAIDCSRIESEVTLLKNLAEKMDVEFELISSLERFRQFVSREAGKSEIQYLFLLDEVDRLVEYDLGKEENIFKTFNKLCTEILESGEPAARFIMCGFQEMFEQMKNPNSRLYNFMIFLPLKPLDGSSALELVTKPMRAIHVHWQDEARDAQYLIDSCSGHPFLLQTACQSLLSILDEKEYHKDTIEPDDVEKALYTDKMQQLCLRFYDAASQDKRLESGKIQKKDNKSFFSFFKRAPSQGPGIKSKPVEKRIMLSGASQKDLAEILPDIHRITILSAIRLCIEDGRESFTMTELQEELENFQLDISTDMMRYILDHLWLSGVFRNTNESMLLAPKQEELEQKAKVIKKDSRLKKEIKTGLTVAKPDVYLPEKKSRVVFKYEFGVRIFPELLVAKYEGIEKCKEELRRLVGMKAVREQRRRTEVKRNG